MDEPLLLKVYVVFCFQVQNAVTFLVDALKTFEWEGWHALTVQTLLVIFLFIRVIQLSNEYN